MPKKTIDWEQLQMDDLLPTDHPHKQGKVTTPPKISDERLEMLEKVVQQAKDYGISHMSGTFIMHHDLANLVGELKWNRRQVKRLSRQLTKRTTKR